MSLYWNWNNEIPFIYVVFQWQKIFSLGIWSPNSTKLWGKLSSFLFVVVAFFSPCLPFFHDPFTFTDSMFLTIYNCMLLLALIFPPLGDSLQRRSCVTYFLNVHVILSEGPFQENPGSKNYPVKRYFEDTNLKSLDSLLSCFDSELYSIRGHRFTLALSSV